MLRRYSAWWFAAHGYSGAERADDVYQELQEQSAAMADQLYVQAEQRDSIYAASRPELVCIMMRPDVPLMACPPKFSLVSYL